MVGHNEHISWGMTLAFTDCEDLFIERLDPGDPRCYEFKGEWRQAEVIKEQIRVKGRQKWVQHPVTITHHGPIISDVVGYKHETLAIQSMALRPSTAIHGWQGLNLASNWDEFVNAVRWINAPQLNIAYADTDGNIGYWVSGEVPIRARGDGSIPAPGWNGDYEWVGVVPFEEMPHAFNPKAGVIVTCNHRIVDSNYPHFLGNVWMNGYRAERIREAFDKLDRISIADCKRLQADLKCLPAKEFIEQIKDLSSDDSEVERVLSLLRSWDAQLERDSIGGTLYEVVRYYLVRNLLEPALGEGLCMQVMGVGFHPLLLSSHEFYGHDTVTMLRLLNEPDSWWVREAGGKHEVLIKSVQQAIEWLKMELGPEVEDWQWGKIHRVPFEHALGLQEPLDRVFNVGPFPIGGDTDTVCQTAMNPEDPYDNKAWAPSFRQVVDLGDLSNSFAIIPPGQSGQLGSRHYDDLVELWLEGEYHPMLWTREQVEREAESRLILRGE
jgi:penicillin amidase